MNVKLLFPESINWDLWRIYKPDVPFSNDVINYLNTLSNALLKDKLSRTYPDVITFAFFCRKANLLDLKDKYQTGKIQLGRGILFHIAPSNVPINFGYSLVAGLLSGNYNIVRVSSKEFPQVDLIVKHICLLNEDKACRGVSQRIALVRYDRTSDATTCFSSFCNVRIIWGGDETISQIRKSPLSPRAFDVTFSDRYSLAVIDAEKLISENNIKKIAEGFYNDTYLFDQNACSAPHLIVWVGKEAIVKEAQCKFWDAVAFEVNKKYELQSVLAIDKLTAFYKQSVNMSIEKEYTGDNSLIRLRLNELPDNIDDFRCAGGYFSEYTVDNMNEIASIVKDKYQTLAYWGFEKECLLDFIVYNKLLGIDRIVPIGETTNFSLTWDGYNLIDTLSRECTVL
jgi:hypothetical protein